MFSGVINTLGGNRQRAEFTGFRREGEIYHVYNRFAQGAEIFREGDEAERFLSLLRAVRERDRLTVFAFCLMSNHHMAVRVGPVSLARTMDRPLEPAAAPAWINERGVSTGLPRPRVELGEFLNRACRCLAVPVARIAGPGNSVCRAPLEQ